MARTITAPDGRVWRIGRDWPTHFKAPRLRQTTRRAGRKQGRGSGLEFLPGDLGDIDNMLGIVVILIFMTVVVTIVLVIYGAPLLVFALEGVVFLAATAWGIVVRQLGRRPWTVRARADGASPAEVRFDVVGWRASGLLASRLAKRLASGDEPDRIRFPEFPQATRRA